ncbi:hypothetical protein F5B20DRAFT_530925 [Whalleya microplaca]|nr:hypothetical protein F5B20DRAFT_530925 [Whalleya microplaca]
MYIFSFAPRPSILLLLIKLTPPLDCPLLPQPVRMDTVQALQPRFRGQDPIPLRLVQYRTPATTGVKSRSGAMLAGLQERNRSIMTPGAPRQHRKTSIFLAPDKNSRGFARVSPKGLTYRYSGLCFLARAGGRLSAGLDTANGGGTPGRSCLKAPKRLESLTRANPMVMSICHLMFTHITEYETGKSAERDLFSYAPRFRWSSSKSQSSIALKNVFVPAYNNSTYVTSSALDTINI